MSEVQNYVLAEQDYMSGMKYKDIADKYGVSLNTVKSWKNRYGWNKKGVHTKVKKVCTQKRKRGGQPGNKNATGPPGNKNAEKHGFFSRHLPAETLSIIEEMPENPLDVLWHQIQIAYAAIIRAQKIMYVQDKEDKTKETIMNGSEASGYNIQQAWDKQATFLSAQARAQKTLEGMINRYEDLLHKEWELATEEQKIRISVLKSKVDADKDQPVQITFRKASEGHGKD